MATDTEMVGEARRLRAAVEACSRYGHPLPAGARPEDLAALSAAFAPDHLPAELLDLLSVMNGTAGVWVTLADVGPLLDCERIVAETASRRWIGEGALPWCSAWTVISSEGHAFAAVLRQSLPLASSAVLDLSYGNQDYPVAAATLTALVSASADAWERGWRDESAVDPSWWPDVRLPLARRADELYPGTSGLRAFDAVDMQPAAWPPAWPDRREEPEAMPGLETLFESRTMRPHRVEVEILARDGRTILGADESGQSWMDLPPAFDPARTIGPGARHQMIVYPVRQPSPADPRATLRVQGVLDTPPADG